MVKTADVVVIGGGCTGASIAYHLAKRGVKRVILLEKNFLASGPTGRSSAIVRQHYSNEVTASMALRSLRVFQHFKDAVGGDCGFIQCGFLMGARAENLAALEANVALQRSLGINTRVVPGRDLNGLESQLHTADIVAAAYEPEGGYCDPAATTASFASRAADLGATIHQGAEVKAITLAGDRVQAVATDTMEIAAPIVVSATGPWAGRVAGLVGLTVPVEPSRHPICTFRRPPDFGKPHMVYADFTNMIYMRPEAGDLTLVGSIDPEDAKHLADPDRYNEGVDFETISGFSAKASRRYPALERAFSKGGWAGIYDVMPDWHPILDEMPGVRGFFCAAGFSGHGFKLCPAVGDMMATLITAGKAAVPAIDFFRATRFAEGKPIVGKYEYSIVG